MALYVVKYTFNAEEEGELSVLKGDVLLVPSNAPPAKDGWTLVETTSAPFTRGYVPTSKFARLGDCKVLLGRKLTFQNDELHRLGRLYKKEARGNG